MVNYLIISSVSAGIGALVSKNKKKGALIGAGVGLLIHFSSALASLGETYKWLQERKGNTQSESSDQ